MTLENYVSTYNNSYDQLTSIREILLDDARAFAGFLDAARASKAPTISMDNIYGSIVDLLGLGPAYDVDYHFNNQKKSLIKAKRKLSTLLHFLEIEKPNIRVYKRACLDSLEHADKYKLEVADLIGNMPVPVQLSRSINPKVQRSLEEIDEKTMDNQLLVARYSRKRSRTSTKFRGYKHIEMALNIIYTATAIANDDISDMLEFADNTYGSFKIFEKFNQGHESIFDAFEKLKEHRIEMYQVVDEALKKSANLAMHIG